MARLLLIAVIAQKHSSKLPSYQNRATLPTKQRAYLPAVFRIIHIQQWVASCFTNAEIHKSGKFNALFDSLTVSLLFRPLFCSNSAGKVHVWKTVNTIPSSLISQCREINCAAFAQIICLKILRNIVVK
jgi:hypothetical protein